MTASSSNSSGGGGGGSGSHGATANSRLAGKPLLSTATPTSQQQAPNNSNSNTTTTTLSIGSSAAFQQVKQTQASLARLSRVHHQIQQQQQQQQPHSSSSSTQFNSGQTNQSSQQQQQQQPRSPSTTFVDCLIRRFKDCFSEDFCTVPMFVVGNLSPGSDGTHLILPPCVSLGRQNINRFAGSKNLRLMNSIRESCRSIEELDLGGNKLTDLIEVYKILQCTPNLRFLNLSENDLSRTWPVAMATSSPAAAGSQTTTGYSSSSSSSISFGAHFSGPQQQPQLNQPAQQPHQHWSASSASGSMASLGQQQRNCLAPLVQNHQAIGGRHTIGARRHSSLGQPLAESAARQRSSVHPGSRVAEARRLAAAAAVAQSRKTSSSVASKLASSAAAASAAAGGHRPLSRSMVQASGARSAGSRHDEEGSAATGVDSTQAGHKHQQSAGKLTAGHHVQRHQTASASTMHLARSLSSLSAKDVRVAASGSSLSSRLSAAQRSTGRKVPAGSAPQPIVNYRQQQQQHRQAGTVSGRQVGSTAMLGGASKSTQQQMTSSSQKLFAEPIVETDADIDMVSDQHHSRASASSAAVQPQQQQSAPATGPIQATTTGPIQATRPITTLTAAASATTTTTATTPTTSGTTNFRRTFESIKALALNNTGCQWRVVCSILSRMPNLEELHLSLNNYERIDLDPNEFKHTSLKRLYLCNNPKLTNWEELDKLLTAFPSLEALSIADCGISQIPDNLDRAREWRKLCGLNINGWPIKEWPVIERLNQLPSLIDLRCRNLEVLNTIDGEPRDHLIARLPRLQRLNGSEIEEEREHAEKAFLRFFMANSHLERPSRFHELVQIHGEVTMTVDVDVDLSPPSQAQVRVIYLNRKENEEDILMSEDFLIKLMDEPQQQQQTGDNMALDQQQQQLQSNTSTATEAGADGGAKQLVRLSKDEDTEVLAIVVDLRQSVRKFKASLASLFGLDSQNLILYYIDREMVGLMGPELLKHNQKKLWNYNVRDGDQFIVEER